MAFIDFMAGPGGRLLRVAAGLAIVAAGYMLHSTAGVVLEIAGAVVFAPLFGRPIAGSRR
jgi:hypothetical protein